MKKLAALLCFCITPLLFAAEPTVEEIVKKSDELYRSKTSYAEMEMQIETADWKRTMRMKAWTEGMKKTFITILEPKKDAGIGTLKIDTKMWNYFPKINKVMQIPPSMMMGSWMGSDFTNDDLVKESTLMDDYTYKLIAGPDAAKYYIELTPKEKTATVWGRIVVVANKSDLLPVAQEFYDEKGTKVRLMTFSDVKVLGGKKIPAVMELRSLTKSGNKTTIIYKDIQFDVKLDPDTFTLRNLQKQR
ncbi:MAG TPA: outer membrane lipoprotein-sorting protein [bacterium]|nr:outer membrane lipoprotein-sorting protein [bacterium]